MSMSSQWGEEEETHSVAIGEGTRRRKSMGKFKASLCECIYTVLAAKGGPIPY